MEPTPKIVQLLRSHYSKPEPEPEPDTGLDFKKEQIKETGANSSPLGRDIQGHDKQLEDEIEEYENFIRENDEKIQRANLSETEISRLEGDNIFYNKKIKEIRKKITELRHGKKNGRPPSVSSTELENTGSSNVEYKTRTKPIPIPRGGLKSKKRKHNKSSKKRKNKSKKRRKKKQTKKRR